MEKRTRWSDKKSENVLRHLGKKYVFMEGEHIRPFYAWLMIGLVAGTAGAYALIASRDVKVAPIEAASETDEIRIDYRYIRDYFTPQVTGFQFHDEIKNIYCSTKSSGYCPLRLYPTPAKEGNYIGAESHDSVNRQIIFRVPRSNKSYQLNIFGSRKEPGWVLYKICPTDKTIRCNEKLRLTGGPGKGLDLGSSFKHAANQNQTIQIFGFDFDAPIAYFTGKHSVRFYGDEAGYVINIPVTPFIGPAWNIYKAFNFPKDHATVQSLDISEQMPANAIIAPNCKENPMVVFTNAPSGSELARRTDDVFDVLFNKALRGMFAYKLIHGSGLTDKDIPTQFSGSGCTKNNRCGENGNNDIVFSYNPNLKAFESIAKESGLPGGIGGAALWYGITASKGYNDVATLPTEMDILVNSSGIDFSNPEHRKSFRAVMSHELIHLFTGRGANNMLEFDIDGNPIVPKQPFDMLDKAFSHSTCNPKYPPVTCNPATQNCYGNEQQCKSLDQGGKAGDACHPTISVEP